MGFALATPDSRRRPRGYRVLPSCSETVLLGNSSRDRGSLTGGGCFHLSGQRRLGLPFHPQRHSDNIARDARRVSREQQRFQVDKGFSSHDDSDRVASVLLEQVAVEPAQRHPAPEAVLHRVHLLGPGVVQDDDHVGLAEGLLHSGADGDAAQHGRHQVLRIHGEVVEGFFRPLVVKQGYADFRVHSEHLPAGQDGDEAVAGRGRCTNSAKQD